jgi:3-hydroxyisobutyrate dehydrogenase
MSNMKVGLLGLGLMGAGMASQLLAKGFDVAVWNRDPAKSEPFAARGARVAKSPADAVQGADVVVAMLSNDEASRQVWLGTEGALHAMAKGAIAIECSTLTATWVRELATAAAAHELGFIDAPVSGSRAQAEAGQLRFLAGGAAETIEQARPVFEAMGTEVVVMGPVGSGALIKLINNFMCGVQGAALAEAFVMAERSGLDLARVAGVLETGAPGSPFVKMLSQRILAGDTTTNFSARLMAKDLGYAITQFADEGIELATANAAQARFLDAANADPDGDISTVIEPVRQQR